MLSPKEVAEDMLEAVRMRRDDMQRTGGMKVPYHGPLCSAQPSVLRDVERWAQWILESEAL